MQKLNLTPQQRLIAADFKPDLSKGQGRAWVENQVLSLAKNLKGTGVGRPIIRANSPYDAAMFTIEEIATALAA